MLYIILSLCSRTSTDELRTWTAAVISLLPGLHVGQHYSIVGKTLGEMIACTAQCVQRAPLIPAGQNEMLWCCNLFVKPIVDVVLPNEDLWVYVLYTSHIDLLHPCDVEEAGRIRVAHRPTAWTLPVFALYLVLYQGALGMMVGRTTIQGESTP